ncbi:diacylglyceryl transferase [bacterium]|mgnify:CR=1 FL=1|nr:diacylglyceryl transferase [bacterium]
MSRLEDFTEIHPIDVVETLATHHEWQFERLADDQIAMVIEGQWRSYSVTLAWSDYDKVLRMICTFDMEPPQDALPALYEVLNLVNEKCWAGAFGYWSEQKLMVYRYGLILAGEQLASEDQIARMIDTAVLASEHYYPAFQLAVWEGFGPQEALETVIAESYGHA